MFLPSTVQIVEKAMEEQKTMKKHFPESEANSVLNFIKGALWILTFVKHKA